MKLRLLFPLFAATAFLSTQRAPGQTLYNINLVFDVASTQFWSWQWIGEVDSVANTFTITQWNMLDTSASNPSASIWTPTTLPLVLNAVDANGQAFDVPDVWDGTIGSDWAFVSPIDNNGLGWNEGSYLPANNALGWGGYKPGPTDPNFHYVHYDENPMLYVPNGTNSVQTVNWTNNTITPVPEPALTNMAVLATAILILVKRRR
ncbi:MAG: hypothetical protein ACSHX9_03590 [Luteolibacter sp.]